MSWRRRPRQSWDRLAGPKRTLPCPHTENIRPRCLVLCARKLSISINPETSLSPCATWSLLSPRTTSCHPRGIVDMLPWSVNRVLALDIAMHAGDIRSDQQRGLPAPDHAIHLCAPQGYEPVPTVGAHGPSRVHEIAKKLERLCTIGRSITTSRRRRGIHSLVCSILILPLPSRNACVSPHAHTIRPTQHNTI